MWCTLNSLEMRPEPRIRSPATTCCRVETPGATEVKESAGEPVRGLLPLREIGRKWRRRGSRRQRGCWKFEGVAAQRASRRIFSPLSGLFPYAPSLSIFPRFVSLSFFLLALCVTFSPPPSLSLSIYLSLSSVLHIKLYLRFRK